LHVNPRTTGQRFPSAQRNVMAEALQFFMNATPNASIPLRGQVPCEADDRMRSCSYHVTMATWARVQSSRDE
jgi:hypothetical protein